MYGRNKSFGAGPSITVLLLVFVVVGRPGRALLTSLSGYPLAVKTLRRWANSVRRFDTWHTFSALFMHHYITIPTHYIILILACHPSPLFLPIVALYKSPLLTFCTTDEDPPIETSCFNGLFAVIRSSNYLLIKRRRCCLRALLSPCSHFVANGKLYCFLLDVTNIRVKWQKLERQENCQD